MLDDTTQKGISTDEIEKRLTALRVDFELILIISISDEERARFLTETQKEYRKFTLLPEVEQKVLVQKLYKNSAYRN